MLFFTLKKSNNRIIEIVLIINFNLDKFYEIVYIVKELNYIFKIIILIY